MQLAGNLTAALLRRQTIFLLVLFLAPGLFAASRICRLNQDKVDGSWPVALSAGDTLFLESGVRGHLALQNLHGSPDQPIVVINQQGPVWLDTGHWYGLSFRHCSHVKLTGRGEGGGEYGIRIVRVGAGSGIGISDGSTAFEIESVEIGHTFNSGIVAKTDPDCERRFSRGNFTLTDLYIHDNWLHDIGQEGMYIGHTFWEGVKLDCNGEERLVLPHTLENVTVCRNRLENIGWDAIQVNSVIHNARVHDNYIYHDSYKAVDAQMCGILIGTGSDAECYNNIIVDGKGSGIEFYGTGGQKIFNNLIVNAGQAYFPLDPEQRKYGIYLADKFTRPDSAFYLYHNTIINPKSDGIRFASLASRRSRIQNNLIVNPGAWLHYETDDSDTRGDDAFVMIVDPRCDVYLSNNLFLRDIDQAFFLDHQTHNYMPGPLSPAIGQGADVGIKFDLRYTPRPQEERPEIGAYESGGQTANPRGATGTLQPGSPVILHPCFPNPMQQAILFSFMLGESREVEMEIYNLLGVRVATLESGGWRAAGLHSVIWDGRDSDQQRLQSGIYWFVLRSGALSRTQRFAIVR